MCLQGQEKMQNLIKSFSCAIRKKRIAQTTNYFYPKPAQSQLILEAGAAIVIRVMRQLSLLQERLLQHNESRKARKSASCADHNGADDEDDDAAADGWWWRGRVTMLLELCGTHDCAYLIAHCAWFAAGLGAGAGSGSGWISEGLTTLYW